jgi:hypothetical protein
MFDNEEAIAAADRHDLRSDLKRLLNAHSAENGSNTPDWILADYLMGCLRAFDLATKTRSLLAEARKVLWPEGGAKRVPHDYATQLPDAIEWLLEQRVTLTDELDKAQAKLDEARAESTRLRALHGEHPCDVADLTDLVAEALQPALRLASDGDEDWLETDEDPGTLASRAVDALIDAGRLPGVVDHAVAMEARDARGQVWRLAERLNEASTKLDRAMKVVEAARVLVDVWKPENDDRGVTLTEMKAEVDAIHGLRSAIGTFRSGEKAEG